MHLGKVCFSKCLRIDLFSVCYSQGIFTYTGCVYVYVYILDVFLFPVFNKTQQQTTTCTYFETACEAFPIINMSSDERWCTTDISFVITEHRWQAAEGHKSGFSGWNTLMERAVPRCIHSQCRSVAILVFCVTFIVSDYLVWEHHYMKTA